jgi:hypothetical protein
MAGTYHVYLCMAVARVNNTIAIRYLGAGALEAWREEFRQLSATAVPVERGGGNGTRQYARNITLYCCRLTYLILFVL